MSIVRLHILLCLLILISCAVSAQERDMILEPGIKKKMIIGFFGGINSISHSGTYSLLDGNQPCCTFGEGSGVDLAIGVRAFIPLRGNLFLYPRLDVEGRGGTLKSALIQQTIRGANNQPEQGTFRNDFEVGLPFIDLDVMIGYTLVPSIGLYVAGGLSTAVGLSKSYTVYENIIGPSGLTYADGVTTRVQTTKGDVEAFNTFQLGLRVAVGANIPLNRRWYITPEVLYHVSLTNISGQSGSNWKTSILQPTLGFSYQL